MRARPIGVPIAVVLFSVLWIVLTITSLAAIVEDPERNAGLAIGLGVCWIALIAFAFVERWTGGRRTG